MESLESHLSEQAVAKTFQRDDLVESLQSCGGRKALGGLCGALYAAMLLAGEGQCETVKEQFLKKIGYLECKAIRKNGHATCADCVRRATEILELTTGDSPSVKSPTLRRLSLAVESTWAWRGRDTARNWASGGGKSGRGTPVCRSRATDSLPARKMFHCKTLQNGIKRSS